MHLVIFYAFGVNRLEGSQADMQRNLGGFNTASANAFKDLRREVQSGCRRGNRSTFSRVDCLISVTVGWVVGPRDVGRQRHMADFFQHSKKIVYRFKTQSPLAELAAG